MSIGFRAFVWVARRSTTWLWRHRRWSAAWLAVWALAWLSGSSLASEFVLVGFLPALVDALWACLWPQSYECHVAGPLRRRYWRKWVRGNWSTLTRQCGLARQVPSTVKVQRGGVVQMVERSVWVPPRLRSVVAHETGVVLRVAAAPGQTPRELEAGAERLGVAAQAHAVHCRRVGPAELEMTFTMVDLLAVPAVARSQACASTDAVRLGRTQDGRDWMLSLTGRHTLVVGCSGSGKGSVLWGVCGGLAPAVAVDLVRIWGIDLKRGVELGMGARLFTTTARTPDEALSVLQMLVAVIDKRGRRMVGRSRQHVPTSGDPMHVLVIDELAALTAYGDSTTCREANRLLGEILTQGRALGVVVVACVQDPRKEVVGLRGLFTQTVALRLRSAAEVTMVLGEGTSELAPAHQISPSAPGTAWVVEEDGTSTRVRADFWPDGLVQVTAESFPTRALAVLNVDSPDATAQLSEGPQPSRPTRARRPRRSRNAATDDPGPGAAA